jgi:hypothetical protein
LFESPSAATAMRWLAHRSIKTSNAALKRCIVAPGSFVPKL